MFKKLTIIWLSVMGFSQFSSPVFAQKSTQKGENVVSQGKYTLNGTVIDQATGQKLQGASIYITDLKKGVVTNDKGQYQIQLTAGNYIVEVSYIGYSITTKSIEISGPSEMNFTLNHSAVENSNVTVTSFLRATSSRKTPTPITIIKKDDLLIEKLKFNVA